MAQPFNPFAPSPSYADAAGTGQPSMTYNPTPSPAQSPFAPVVIPTVASPQPLSSPPAGSTYVASPPTLHQADVVNLSVQAPAPQPTYYNPGPAAGNPNSSFTAFGTSPAPAATTVVQGGQMGYILHEGQLIPVMIPASVAAIATPAPVQPHPSLAPPAEAFDPFGTELQEVSAPQPVYSHAHQQSYAPLAAYSPPQTMYSPPPAAQSPPPPQPHPQPIYAVSSAAALYSQPQAPASGNRVVTAGSAPASFPTSAFASLSPRAESSSASVMAPVAKQLSPRPADTAVASPAKPVQAADYLPAGWGQVANIPAKRWNIREWDPLLGKGRKLSLEMSTAGVVLMDRNTKTVFKNFPFPYIASLGADSKRVAFQWKDTPESKAYQSIFTTSDARAIERRWQEYLAPLRLK